MPTGNDRRSGKPVQGRRVPFNTIFGSFQGHKIYASRKVAEKIEVQTRYAAELCNVDVDGAHLPQLGIMLNDSYMLKEAQVN